MKLCIVIPARNEQDTIARVVARARQYGEVFVADDSSTDFTAERAANAGAIVVSVPKDRRGLAGVYRHGLLKAASIYARCDYVIELDAGGSHDPSDLDEFFPFMNGVSVVFGRRFGAGASYQGAWTRRWLSWLGTKLYNAIQGSEFLDATSGFIAYPRHLLELTHTRPFQAQGHYYQSEVRTRVLALGQPWAEVPIHFVATKSTLRWRAVWEAFRLVWTDLRWP